MRLILLFLALFVLAAFDRQKPPTQQGDGAQQGEQAAQGAEDQSTVGDKGVHRDNAGKSAPTVSFKDPDGGEISIADFKGVPVLVNLWATWCGPCIKELPTLAKLSDAHLQDGQLGVIAVSQDRGPQGSVVAFLKAHEIDGLGAYQDPEMALAGALGVQIMPTTVLYDRQGREVWRYVGDLDWTSPEAAKLLAEAS